MGRSEASNSCAGQMLADLHGDGISLYLYVII